MARLFTSGFELQSVVNGVEWYASSTLTHAGDIVTSPVRSGAAAFRVANPTAATPKGINTTFVGSGSNGVDYFLRAYVYIVTLPDVDTGIIGFGDANVAQRGRVLLKTTGALEARVDTTESAGTSATLLTTGQWYRIELRMRRHASTPNAGADEVEVKIDGVTEILSTTQSLNGLWTRILLGMNLVSADTASAGEVVFDDLALNDSNGSDQNTWPGAGSVVSLFPTGAGDSAITQDVTLTGSAPAATAWQSVDDGTATGTVDGVDDVTFDATTANWTGTGDRLAVAVGNLPESASAVALVALGVRAGNMSGSTSTYQLSAQTSDGGTRATDSTPFTPAHATDWLLNNNLSNRAANPYTLYLDPGGAPWTTETVNALQLLLRSVDASPAIRVTAMWATVEYTPGGAVASLPPYTSVQRVPAADPSPPRMAMPTPNTLGTGLLGSQPPFFTNLGAKRTS